MKKKLALIMAGIMALTMTACSKDEGVNYGDETEEVSDSADKDSKKDKDSDKDEDIAPVKTEEAETPATEASTSAEPVVTEAPPATEPEQTEEPESMYTEAEYYAAFEQVAGDYENCVEVITSEAARDKWYKAVCEAYGMEFTDEEFATIMDSALSEENLNEFRFPLPNGAAKLSIKNYGTIEVFGADGYAVCSGTYDLVDIDDGVYIFQDKSADDDFEYGTLLVVEMEGFDGLLTGAFETNGYFNSMDDIHVENMFMVLNDEGLDTLIGYVMDVALSAE